MEEGYLVILTVKIPKPLVKCINTHVKTGRYANRSEFIRAAIRAQLDREAPL